MPYTAEFNDYYLNGHEEGVYQIRVHKKKGIFSPQNQPKPYRESIPFEHRESHAIVPAE
jgi:hypothetical protein